MTSMSASTMASPIPRPYEAVRKCRFLAGTGLAVRRPNNACGDSGRVACLARPPAGDLSARKNALQRCRPYAPAERQRDDC